MSDQAPHELPCLTYVVSQYPMLSMIFIIREVLQLRKLGFNIDVASINTADRSIEELTDDEATEAALTYYVKAHGIKGALAAHGKALKKDIAGYLRGLRLVFKLGGTDLRSIFNNLMYFTEALMIGIRMDYREHKHLHAHLGSQSATVGMYVKKVFGFGFSITLHGSDEFYDTRGQYLTQKVEAADFICCISKFARSQLMYLSGHEHWHKLEVSRLGVDPELFTPRPFEENPETFEIVCIGRLNPSKGQNILINAVANLLGQGRNVRLRIIGGGIEYDALTSRVHELNYDDHIIFEGIVNQDRIREFYSRAHAFSLPSFAEGIPVVLMEAMAMEIPCVTTRICGIPELIRDGIDGLLVTPSATDELTAALSRLMDDPDLRRELGENGRKRVMGYYNLSKNVDRLADIFQRRLGEKTTL